MNERIRELAEQADIHFSKSGTLDAGPNGIAKFVLYADLQKFAELIVRECRDIVEQDMKLAHIQMIPLTLEKYANSRLKQKIQEHFGVAE